ncbi:MAG TPA: hypothetical protein VEK11_04295 [Thermoanaerobaculia bacterium]|nr:hypothetical protein [Thermoanaerobaculia bacterium]
MKRSLVVLTTLVVMLALAACSTVTAPGTAGVVTKVEGNAVTIASSGTETTYTVGSSTNVYAPDGVSTQRSYLTAGQRVLVWANGTNAVRINVQP